jgi:type II secretory pathway component PulF
MIAPPPNDGPAFAGKSGRNTANACEANAMETHSLHQALVDGRIFSQALSEMPRIFPPLYVNLVAAGEASGALPQILEEPRVFTPASSHSMLKNFQ